MNLVAGGIDATLPLVLWVAFAGALNEEVWRRNRSRQGIPTGWRRLLTP